MKPGLIWRLAYRYLRGKRLGNAVPILSRISMVAIAVSSAAMIIIFSVFNGLEKLVKDQYKGFYPDIKITAVKGKFFATDSSRLAAIARVAGVQHVTETIEDNVLVINNDQQIPVILKGIQPDYFQVNNIRDSIAGADSVSVAHHTCIMGVRIAHILGVDVNNAFSTIQLYYLNAAKKNFTDDPAEAFQSLQLHAVGVFRVADEFDDRYILAPFMLVQELLLQKSGCSAIEISADKDHIYEVRAAIQKLYGPAYKVETRYEQNHSMYQVMGTEKWAVYAILVLVLLIACFNMVGALSMLVLEKQKDIAILRAMGATGGNIRLIFLSEGILWSLFGGLGGIMIGASASLLQEYYGFIKMGGNWMVDAYPSVFEIGDVLLVFVTILAVGLLTSWVPAWRSARTADPTLKSA